MSSTCARDRTRPRNDPALPRESSVVFDRSTRVMRASSDSSSPTVPPSIAEVLDGCHRYIQRVDSAVAQRQATDAGAMQGQQVNPRVANRDVRELATVGQYRAQTNFRPGGVAPFAVLATERLHVQPADVHVHRRDAWQIQRVRLAVHKSALQQPHLRDAHARQVCTVEPYAIQHCAAHKIARTRLVRSGKVVNSLIAATVPWWATSWHGVGGRRRPPGRGVSGDA